MSYSWFRRGTCTVTNGDARVNFQNANITTAPNKPTVGDAFMINNSDLYEIIFIGSDSTGEFVTLDRGFNEASASNSKYAMMRLASANQNASLVAKASAAINQKQISLDDMYEWYTATTDTVDFDGPDGQAVTVVSYHKLSLDIATVGTHVSEIEIVASNIDVIKTVEADVDNVKAVGADIASVKDASDNMADIKAVNANKANIDHVAGESADINTVSANIVAVKDVARNESNVNIVGGDIQSVNTAAANIDAIKAAPAEAQAAAASAKSASDDADQVSIDKSEVSSDKQIVTDAQSDVTQKHTIVVAKATQVDLDAAQVTQDTAKVAADKLSVEDSEAQAKKWAVGDGAPPNNVPSNKNNAFYWSEQSKFHSNQTFRFGGFILPVPGNDYPDYASVTRDTQWVIKFDDVNDNYTYTDGPFNGKNVSNGDQIYYDTPSNVLTLVQPPGKGGILEVNGYRGASVTLDYADVGAADERITVQKISQTGPVDIQKGSTATRPDTSGADGELALLWFNPDVDDYEVWNPKIREWRSLSKVKAVDTSYNDQTTNAELAASNVQDKLDLLDKLVREYANPNLFINGDFQDWQRGDSGIGTDSFSYVSADRWFATTGLILQKNVTASPTSNNPQTARLKCNGTLQAIGQRIEYSKPLVGEEVTVSFDIVVSNITATDGFIALGWVTPQTDQRNNVIRDNTIDFTQKGKVTSTFTVPTPNDVNDVLEVRLFVSDTETAIGDIYLANAKLERGSVATAFIPDTPEVNLAKCQRYYQKSNVVIPSSPASNARRSVAVIFPTPMRVVPDITETVSGDQGWTKNAWKDGFRLRWGSGLTANETVITAYKAAAEL